MKKPLVPTTFARRLRRSATNAEKALWTQLRNRQLESVKFRRQQPLGAYIVDFVCFERKLVIEVDGGQHNEAGEQEELRTQWLLEQGYRVLRFWNNEVLTNMEGVLASIRASLEVHPHPRPLPSSRERERAGKGHEAARSSLRNSSLLSEGEGTNREGKA